MTNYESWRFLSSPRSEKSLPLPRGHHASQRGWPERALVPLGVLGSWRRCVDDGGRVGPRGPRVAPAGGAAPCPHSNFVHFLRKTRGSHLVPPRPAQWVVRLQRPPLAATSFRLPSPPLTPHPTKLHSANPQQIRAQALRDVRDAERGVVSSQPSQNQNQQFNGKITDEHEIAGLVGQLERYAERKTGRVPVVASTREDQRTNGLSFGGQNRVNKQGRPPSPRNGVKTKNGGLRPFKADDSVTSAAERKWGAKRGTSLLSSDEAGAGDENGPGYGKETADETAAYQNSLVGGWDGASSAGWENASVPEDDVRSVFSFAVEDSFLNGVPYDEPRDLINRVGDRVEGVSENLSMHRRQLEKTMGDIESAQKNSDLAASLETDGMFTAGKSVTGVGVIDFFAKDPKGVGPKGSLAQTVNERANANSGGTNKWLSPAPKRKTEKKTEPPEEPSPVMRMLRSVFTCGCGR